LAELLKDEYDLFHFSETIDDDNLVFDYKLKEGSLKKGNAIKMLQIIGYPDSVIREALDIVNKIM
jgi:DNA mismatch repair ATPase MutS